MTQEFVTLPREVVERAMSALEFSETQSHRHQYDVEASALAALSAALEQPQDHVPDAGNMVPAGWKLVPVEPTLEMIEAGKDAHYEAENRIQEPDAWEQGGFAKRAVRAAHVFQAMLDAAPQLPVVEQPQADQPAMTPIAQRKLDSLLTEGYTISGYSVYHERKHQHGFVTSAGLVGWWKPDGMEYPQPQGEQEPVGKLIADPYEGHIFIPYGDSWPFNEDLYTHPQPKHEPLTDEQIADAVRGFYSSDKAAELGFPDDACTARAIERAHNIK